MAKKTVDGTIELALGQKGYGKTTRLKARLLTRANLHRRLPIFIHDLRAHEPSSVGALARHKWREPTELLAADQAELGRSHVFYECAAEEVASLTWQWCAATGRGAIVVIDELDQFPPMLAAGWTINKRGHRVPKSAGYALANYGRTKPLFVLGSARQMQDVAKCWLSQADEIDFFRCSTKQLLRQILQSGWEYADYIGQRLPALPKYRYLTIIK